MKRRITSKIFVLSLIFIILSSNTFAAAAQTLTIDGKEIGNSIKVIDGKQYILVDSLTENLNNITVNRTGNSVEINTNSNSISKVVDSVSPSVVGIMGKLKESSPDYNLLTDNLIFGTGVIYRSDGYIITNSHVVKDMDSIVVVLSNSKAYKARLKAIDDNLDLAVIKIDKGGLKPAIFGDIAEVTVGEEVVAIGTPLSFSLRNSATKGIVSGMNRSADGEYKFIQSDAAINGGNSGGPLVNMKGQVIGINSVKFVGYGIEGLSFSIPVDTVKYAINHFEKYGYIKRPYLGMIFSDSITAMYGLPSITPGVAVKEIEEGSPAEGYDIQLDDKVISVNGVDIFSIVDYNEEMKKYLPGDKAVLKIIRDSKEFNIEVVFDEKAN